MSSLRGETTATTRERDRRSVRCGVEGNGTAAFVPMRKWEDDEGFRPFEGKGPRVCAKMRELYPTFFQRATLPQREDARDLRNGGNRRQTITCIHESAERNRRTVQKAGCISVGKERDEKIAARPS